MYINALFAVQHRARCGLGESHRICVREVLGSVLTRGMFYFFLLFFSFSLFIIFFNLPFTIYIKPKKITCVSTNQTDSFLGPTLQFLSTFGKKRKLLPKFKTVN